jgi:DNA-binding transcriptional MocR family regulator
MLPEALEAKCAALGKAGIKPRALFIIPVGQNPTGKPPPSSSNNI